jgi:two-component system, NtrC family, nitrogen regulation sensor histidine kinase NtrY
MNRFLWKVVSLMVLVAVIPVGIGVVVVDQTVKETVAIGMDDRVKGSLERSSDVYRNYISLRREVIGLWVTALAHDEQLLASLSDERAARALLVARANSGSSPDQGIAYLALEGPAKIVVDRTSRYPEARWRGREVVRTVVGPDGGMWKLRVRVVVPWALFHDYQALGGVQETFANMDDRQASLSGAYSKAFVASSLGALFLAILLGVLLARGTTGRLGRLHAATAVVAAGDWDHEVAVRGSDEIAELTRAFNGMVRELRQSRDRVAYLERVSAWQEIARRLAHEIKNPLTPILLAVQQLDRKFDAYGEDPPRYRALVTDSLEIVTEEVGALRRLVHEFRDFARLPRVEPEPVEVRRYVAEFLKTSPQFEPYVARFDADGEAMVAEIDTTLMRRCLDNLVQNAAQAVDGAGLAQGASVKVSVERSDDEVVIRVEDVGPGIPQENLALLFQPYFTTKGDGTGLGLPIVRKTVIDHGGDITVQSPLDENGGTRFEIRLPRVG